MNIAAPAPETASAPTVPAIAFAVPLDLALSHLLDFIAARFRILGPLTMPLWRRVSRARQRLARFLAACATGRLPRPRPPQAGRTHGAGAVRKAAAFPMRRGWFVHLLGYEAAGYRAQLTRVLRDPEAATILAASPGAARTMRALCHMLGIDLPEPLRRTPPPPCAVPPSAVPPSRLGAAIPAPGRGAASARGSVPERPGPPARPARQFPARVTKLPWRAKNVTISFCSASIHRPGGSDRISAAIPSGSDLREGHG